MKLVDLRLPDQAITLLDTLKHRYPHINGKPSRTSVILWLLAETPAQAGQELHHQTQLQTWLDHNHPQRPPT